MTSPPVQRRVFLSSTNADLKEYREKVQTVIESLSLGSQALGEGHHTVAMARQNLGIVLGQVGDLVRAKGHFELALASHVKNISDDHPDTAIVRSNLAGLLQALHQPHEARAMAIEALRVARLQPEGSLARENIQNSLEWAEQ